MPTEVILIAAFGGAGLVYAAGRFSAALRNVLVVAVSVLLIGLVALSYGQARENTYYLGFLGLDLVLRHDALSWFFALCVSVVGAASLVFSLGYIGRSGNVNFYYFCMLLVTAAMLGIVLSGDLLSLFIFWEIMSWSAYLLISHKRGRALQAAMKYIVMSLIGSCAMLLGVLALCNAYGTLTLSKLAEAMGSADGGFLLFVLVTFGIGFGVKAAMVPLHTWLPDAHSEAPSPFSAVLSGVLIKMGIYGFILVMYAVVGLKLVLGLGTGWLNFHSVLCWLAAVTIVIPTFVAMLQTDAKRLLAWSSIGQIGYIVLGLAFGTTLGVAGATFHTLNHAFFKALLFLSVGVVEYKTGGVRDLNQLGGLARRMPVTFACALIGGLGLIGVPLTGGFVSKWLIYKTLIAEGHPFLALAALIGTWGAILYIYKLLHNVFLGQLPERYAHMERPALSMTLPLVVLGAAVVFMGVLPGIPLRAVGAIVTSLGVGSFAATAGGFGPELGPLNTVNICFAVVALLILVTVVLRLAAKARRVPQTDTYAAGAFVPTGKYHHTVGFYEPLERMVKPYLRDRIDALYTWTAEVGRGLFDRIRRIYTGDVRNYVMYIVGLLALLIFVQLVWKMW